MITHAVLIMRNSLLPIAGTLLTRKVKDESD